MGKRRDGREAAIQFLFSRDLQGEQKPEDAEVLAFGEDLVTLPNFQKADNAVKNRGFLMRIKRTRLLLYVTP